MSGASRWCVRAVLVLGASLALAARASAAPNCTISTTSASFGPYDVFSGTATDTTGSVTYQCTGSAILIAITLSKGSSTTFSPRTLTSGSDTLNYNLYRDAARTTIWGDGTGGTQVYFNLFPPNGQNIVVTVFGRITAGQDVPAGSYADTVTAIINF